MRRVRVLRDRFVVALIASALGAAGFLALAWPVALDDYDRWGFRIHCGTGFVAEYTQAATAGADHVEACRSAVWMRRGWAGLLVLVGAGGLVAVSLAERRSTSVAEVGGGR